MQCAGFDNPGLRAALVLVVTALLTHPTEIIADVIGSPQPSTISASTDPSVLAALVDRMIGDALNEQQVTPAGLTSDEDFLRRVTLDLAGRIPSANDVTLFSLNPDPDKRSGVIESLLSSDEFAQTWASYWRDVIFSRATEMRSRMTQRPFEDWLTAQLKGGRPWNEIVTELLTATGNTQEEGRTALISAHNGDPAELASEASRIFLGIQMQCANCHNHPYDSWTREDFHELAAFFPHPHEARSVDTASSLYRRVCGRRCRQPAAGH